MVIESLCSKSETSYQFYRVLVCCRLYNNNVAAKFKLGFLRKSIGTMFEAMPAEGQPRGGPGVSYFRHSRSLHYIDWLVCDLFCKSFIYRPTVECRPRLG
jgi:hypothetical protein